MIPSRGGRNLNTDPNLGRTVNFKSAIAASKEAHLIEALDSVGLNKAVKTSRVSCLTLKIGVVTPGSGSKSSAVPGRGDMLYTEE